MIRTVVCDLDDTLIVSKEMKVRAFYEVSKEHPASAGHLDQIFKDPDRGDRFGIFKTLAGKLDPENTSLADELSSEYSEFVERYVATCPEVKGAVDFFKKAAKKRIPVYVNSSTPEKSLIESMKKRGWFPAHLAGVFGRPASKEDNLKKIMGREKIPPSALLMIGDGLNDYEAAKNIGCPFIAMVHVINRFKDKVTVKTAADMHEAYGMFEKMTAGSVA